MIPPLRVAGGYTPYSEGVRRGKDETLKEKTCNTFFLLKHDRLGSVLGSCQKLCSGKTQERAQSRTNVSSSRMRWIGKDGSSESYPKQQVQLVWLSNPGRALPLLRSATYVYGVPWARAHGCYREGFVRCTRRLGIQTGEAYCPPKGT